jgi:hypothetical protein
MQEAISETEISRQYERMNMRHRRFAGQDSPRNSDLVPKLSLVLRPSAEFGLTEIPFQYRFFPFRQQLQAAESTTALAKNY